MDYIHTAGMEYACCLNLTGDQQTESKVSNKASVSGQACNCTRTAAVHAQRHVTINYVHTAILTWKNSAIRSLYTIGHPIISYVAQLAQEIIEPITFKCERFFFTNIEGISDLLNMSVCTTCEGRRI